MSQRSQCDRTLTPSVVAISQKAWLHATEDHFWGQ